MVFDRFNGDRKNDKIFDNRQLTDSLVTNRKDNEKFDGIAEVMIALYRM